MLRIRLSPLAQGDLDGIWDFTVQRWDVAQAESYLLALDQTMRTLAENPHMGVGIDDIREGYFKFPSGSHLLVYRLKPGAIEFMRVLHKAMDVERNV